MNKLFNIVKVDLIHNYSINKLSKKHNQKRNLNSFIATIILSIFLLISVFIMMFSLGEIAKEVNQLDFILAFGYTVASFLCFTVTISKANGLLFESKDFELLVSMPINTKTIVLSKLISLVILNYLNFGLIYIPCIIVYGVLSSATILYYIFSFISFIIGPLLIITICSFISYLLGLLLRKTKAKSIITSILSLLIFIFVFVFYMTFVNKIDMADGSNIDYEYFSKYFSNMTYNFKTYYPITKILINGLHGDFLQYLLYILLMLVPFSALVCFVGKNYLKANMRAKITNSSKHFKMKTQKQNSKIVAILKRDFKRFFSSSAQVLNIGIGPIISTVLVVVMAINFSNEVDIVNDEFYKDFMPILLTLTVGFTYGIMPSTSSSISLEGKNFWILKSSPIKTKDIFISKILFYLIICFPFIIINVTIISVILKLNILNIIVELIVQILLVLLYATEGLWINILVPKFDWDNEVKAIKQGTGPLLSMLIGFGLDLVLYITPFIGMTLGLNGLIILMINAFITLVVLALILFTHGKSKFEKIQA